MATERPRQNRVTPGGDIVAVPQRGTLMGNRGVIHDDAGQIVRPWQLQRWIACVTEFRGRWRPVMTPRRWTELFFLDEATALAAGHRPCAHCRHADYQRFRRAWADAQGSALSSAEQIDRVMHADRLDEHRRKRTYRERLDRLPDGTMVEVEGGAYLVQGDELVCWSFGGYLEERLELTAETEVDVLTPRVTVAVIAAGYAPALHGSATDPA